jgi:hypothetical protein
MKKQILFVIMAMCATCAMAVNLPNNSYNPMRSSITTSNESYTLGTGISFNNTAVVGEYVNGSCQVNKQDPNAITLCEKCCEALVFGEDGSLRDEDYYACINDCMGYSLPLDASVYFLLALVAAYGAVAVYRRKAGEKVA